MTTALVLAGGSSLGAVQVGTLRALVATGVGFDLIVGTSVGGPENLAPHRHGSST